MVVGGWWDGSQEAAHSMVGHIDTVNHREQAPLPF